MQSLLVACNIVLCIDFDNCDNWLITVCSITINVFVFNSLHIPTFLLILNYDLLYYNHINWYFGHLNWKIDFCTHIFLFFERIFLGDRNAEVWSLSLDKVLPKFESFKLDVVWPCYCVIIFSLQPYFSFCNHIFLATITI